MKTAAVFLILFMGLVSRASAETAEVSCIVCGGNTLQSFSEAPAQVSRTVLVQGRDVLSYQQGQSQLYLQFQYREDNQVKIRAVVLYKGNKILDTVFSVQLGQSFFLGGLPGEGQSLTYRVRVLP
jgi:hypothetical protein